jgi:hypothetical protein
MSVLDQFPWIIFPFIDGHIVLLFFVCLVVFDWMPDHVNFASLGAWRDYLPMNVLSCSSGM